MKKGFTLIELLAVIVILAIIALIATPIVLNIINDTKESARLRSTEFYLDSVDYAISMRILNGKTVEDGVYDILESGNICLGTVESGTDEEDECRGDELEVKVEGERPNGGNITIENGQVVSHVIKYDDVIVGNEEETPEPEPEGTVAGLYQTGTDTLLKTWDQLLAEGQVIVTDGAAKAGSNFAGGDLIFPDDGSVTSIADSGFQSCSNLTGITIPGSITTVEDYAFYRSKLKFVTMEEGVKKIGSYAFAESQDTSQDAGGFRVKIPASVENLSWTFLDDNFTYYDTLDNLIFINFAGTVGQWDALVAEGRSQAEMNVNMGIAYYGYPTVTCNDGTTTTPMKVVYYT